MDESRQRAAVIEAAVSWLGTPFAMNQGVRGLGIDCGLFLCEAFEAAGVPVPDPARFPFFPVDWHLHTLEERYLDILSPYASPVGEPQPGDIAMFRMTRHRPAPWSHSGIVIEWPRIIHAFWKSGVEYADAEREPLKRLPVLWLSPWNKK